MGSQTLLKDYPGAKNGSGIIPWLINNIPCHNRYFELFAGSAALYRAKKPADYNRLYDINPVTVMQLRYDLADRSSTAIFNGSALNALTDYQYSTADFIYLDPPYHKDDRRSGAEIYDFEMMGDDDHIQLLTAILASTANIMISCGRNKLYELYLKDWLRKEFATQGHMGRRYEVIYMNYPEPQFLHQYDYLGNDYKQRQALSRKRVRWQQLVHRLPPHQRHVLIQELIKNNPAEVQHFMAVSAGTNS